MRLILRNFPHRTANQEQEVEMQDVRAYVVAGLKEEHPIILKASEKVERTNNEILRLQKMIHSIPKTVPRDPVSNWPLEGVEADEEREAMYQKALKDKELLELTLVRAKDQLAVAAEEVANLPFEVELAGVDEALGLGTWFLNFDGVEDDNSTDGDFVPEMALVTKKDWEGIKLACGHVDDLGSEIPPWAGRGDIPSGEKSWEPNYARYEVQTGGVVLLRAQHGIGLWKSLQKADVPFYGPNYEVYHGQWFEGVKHGYGLQYDDRGVYGGFWEAGNWRGEASFDYPHGLTYKGNFGTQMNHKSGDIEFEPMTNNPYANGIPNDPNGLYQFGDGSTYQGSIVDARVTGQGKYINAMGEVFEGEFKDGVLHGQGKHTDVLGNVFEGRFRYGELDREGTYVSHDRNIYIGTWKNGEKHGRGFQRR